MVEVGVGRERRCLVYLQEPGFAVLVDQDVEAKHFETDLECPVIRLISLVIVKEVGLNSKECFDDNVCNF